MFALNYSLIFPVFGLFLFSTIPNASGECDRKLCPGPLYYYEELGCTPIFDNATSCCPTRYNCDVWKNLPEDKCFVGGRIYENGERLPSGYTSDPCNHCNCQGRYFVCAIPSCVAPRMPGPGCRHHFSRLDCCQFHEICENSPVACTVDGKSYKIGETFHPVAEPEKTCYCKKGYSGVNDENFCVWRKPSWCDNVISSIENIRRGCPPVYEKDAALYKDCNDGHICPEAGTFEIERNANNVESIPGTVETKAPEKQCNFGNSKMNIGERVTSRRYFGDPVQCICEVPPIPSCYNVQQHTSRDVEISNEQEIV